MSIVDVAEVGMVASVGDGCLTIVHPVVAIGFGGVSTQTRPSPHHSTKSARSGS